MLRVAGVGFAEVQRQEYVSREAERVRLERLGIEQAKAAAIAAQSRAK